jgi:DNA repair exonuclease SbcCD ATPase subunit/DNA repair exonuclease SbcCD nuclease subunit
MAYNKIAHISDIHIRKNKRHKEYRHVFANLYKSLKKNKVDAIVLGGDIVHNKTDLSPEAVQLMGDFFTKLAKIAPVFCIVGNHDCIINQKGRLNSISPVVDLLDLDNFTVFDKSGLFEYGDVVFGVFDVNDEKRWPIDIEREEGKIYVGLFHGAINNSITNKTFKLETRHNISMFKNYHYVMMGDIHTRQYVDDKKTVAYSGTLIQQNFGEDHNKGYLLWDLSEGTSDFVHVESDYGFRTYQLTDDEVENIENISLPDVPKNCYMRVFVSSKQYNVVNTSSIEHVINRKYDPLNLYIKPYDNIDYKDFDVTDIEIDDVTKLQTQSDLLKEYFNGSNYDDKFMEKIMDSHKEYYNMCNFSGYEHYKAKKWIIKKVKFSNVFSYGEDNEVNFQNLSGIMGIFSENASGKSNLLYTILTGFFNASARASRNNIVDVINDHKNEANIEIEFSVDGNDYVIRRNIKRLAKDKSRAKTTVKLYQIVSGEEIDLMGKNNTTATEKHIRSLLGTFEEHSMTTFSQQFDITNFIDYNQASRKELLSRFLGLDVIESLYRTIKDDNIALKRVLKQYDDHDYQTIYENTVKQEREIQDKIISIEEEKIARLGEIGKNNKMLTELRKKMKNVEKQLDIKALKEEEESIVETIDRSQIEHIELVRQSENMHLKIKELQEVLSEMRDSKEIVKDIEEHNEVVKNWHHVEKSVEYLKREIKNKERATSILLKHDWFETEEACKSCTFLSDAFGAREKLPILEEDLKRKTVELEDLEDMASDYEDSQQELDELENIKQGIKEAKKDYDYKCLRMETISDKIVTLADKLDIVRKNISAYESNKKAMSGNEVTQKEIDNLEKESERINNYIVNNLDQELSSLKVLYGQVDSKLDSLNETLEKIREVEDQYETNSKLSAAFSPDGIPFMIISKVVPVINNRIKDILHDLEGFDVFMDIDKISRDLLVYIDDGVMKKRVEKGSGMEKTIAALSIRAALANISLLPHCNLFVVDEGFGTLDSNHLQDVNQLLLYLKTQFTNVMIISHIESMKDIADNIVSIYKDENSFSHIDIK